MWEYLIASFLSLHGLAHLIGFMGTWHLGPFVDRGAPRLPFGLTDGGGLARTLGALWIGGMVLFVATAVGAVMGAAWWPLLLIIAATSSLALCVLWWNDARVGAAIDIAMLVSVGLARTLPIAA